MHMKIKIKNPEITLSRVKEVLFFEPQTGRFFWIKPTARNVKIGSMAGRKLKDGYRIVCIDRLRIFEHRLVWLFLYGTFPNDEVDHINHIRDDNKPSNLRLVSRLENNQNKSIGKNNSSGFVGICWNKVGKNWMASISINSKRIHLGYFKNIEDAVNAREIASAQYKFHKNHGK